MNLKELKTLIAKGEGQYIEFKKNANEPAQIAEEVVGFANSKGGNLFIGVNDQGLLTGLKYSEDDLIFLSDYINFNISPVPIYSTSIVSIDKSKSVLVLNISSGKSKPYGLKIKDSDARKILYRVDDLCLQASRELKNILRNSNQDRGITIIYTDLENLILKFIDKNGQSTKREITRNLGFSSRKVSDCLVRLVSSEVLRIIPGLGEDLYEYQ